MAWTCQEGLGDGIVAGMSCRVGAVEEGRREESSSRINSAIHRIDAGEMRTVLYCMLDCASYLPSYVWYRLYGIYGTRITSLFRHSFKHRHHQDWRGIACNVVRVLAGYYYCCCCCCYLLYALISRLFTPGYYGRW